MSNFNPQNVCVQGLGFVGFAMAVAVAYAKDESGEPHFHVTGVELETPAGREKVHSINNGRLPIESSDTALTNAFDAVYKQTNFSATTDEDIYAQADVVLMDVDLSLDFSGEEPKVDMERIVAASRTLGKLMKPGALLIVETTVPPGTCEFVIAPILHEELAKRGLNEDAILLAHSYERVMPGDQYFHSIINYWRVYAGLTEAAANACETFLSRVINVKDYPLTRLNTIRESETAKVLENSYRAANIAFIDEWGRFAEAVGIDLFSVIDAVRKRPTHSNIREPGFGVGGYCLTKDPLWALYSAQNIFKLPDIDFPFCRSAVRTNQAMPLASVNMLQSLLGGNLKDKRVAIIGVAYKPDIGDTRYSPSEIFAKALEQKGAQLSYSDSFVDIWPEMNNASVSRDLPDPKDLDALVFAVGHKIYGEIDFKAYLGGANPAILDANHVLSDQQLKALEILNISHACIGRGEERKPLP